MGWNNQGNDCLVRANSPRCPISLYVMLDGPPASDTNMQAETVVCIKESGRIYAHGMGAE